MSVYSITYVAQLENSMIHRFIKSGCTAHAEASLFYLWRIENEELWSREINEAQVQLWSSDGKLWIITNCLADRNGKKNSKTPCWQINSVACWPQSTQLYTKHVVVRTDFNYSRSFILSSHSFITSRGNLQVSFGQCVTFLLYSFFPFKSQIQGRHRQSKVTPN